MFTYWENEATTPASAAAGEAKGLAAGELALAPHGVHPPSESPGPKKPATHEHVMLPSAETELGGQGVQAALPEAPTTVLKVPFGHGTQRGRKGRGRTEACFWDQTRAS